MSKGILVVVRAFRFRKGTVMKRLIGKNMTIMHYLFLLLPEIQDQARRTERLISSAQKKNLNS